MKQQKTVNRVGRRWALRLAHISRCEVNDHWQQLESKQDLEETHLRARIVFRGLAALRVAQE